MLGRVFKCVAAQHNIVCVYMCSMPQVRLSDHTSHPFLMRDSSNLQSPGSSRSRHVSSVALCSTLCVPF